MAASGTSSHPLPQPQHFGDNFSVVATEYDMGYSGSWNKEICQSVNGFIYLNDKVCNPCTGQHITLPKVGTGNVILKCFFGYDPIRKQFKVLCWSKFYRQQQITSNEKYQVLTLGTGELLWRKIECSFPHDPQKEKNGICFNGVLYYIASMKYRYNSTAIIVCFDVRSEKFSFIETELKEVWGSILLEYKGKLGVLLWSGYSNRVELWVLDDTKKVKWSKHKFVLPYTSEEVKKSIWATDTGKLVWASSSGWKHPLYVNYYNLESKSVRRLEIKGTKDKESLLTFTNYVENMMFLQQH